MNKLLSATFCFILGLKQNGGIASNWFSQKFHHWKQKREQELATGIESRWKQMTYFNVEGAGKIQVSNMPDWSALGGTGFHVGVSWSEHPYIGGVITVAQAKLLVAHLSKALEGLPEDYCKHMFIKNVRGTDICIHCDKAISDLREAERRIIR